MGYFPVDDDAAFHVKIVLAGNAAVGAWTRCGSWSRKHGTGGFVPDQIAKQIGSRTELKKLVDVGLFEQVLGGYLFHDWSDYGSNQGPADAEAELQARKANDKRRQQQKRDREKAEREAIASRDNDPTSRDGDATSSRDASRDDHVTGPVDKRDSHVTLSRARSRAVAVQSQSHLEQVPETSPVSETSREKRRTDHENAEAEYIQAAATRQVDFRKVRARYTAQAGELVPARTVYDAIVAVTERAPHRDGDRTGLVITSLRDDWAEHSQRLYANTPVTA
jgi:hypothetical protein